MPSTVKKTRRIEVPIGVGEYEFPNPYGGGVFCLQRRLIDAMREQCPGEVLAFFQLASKGPLQESLARVSSRSWAVLEHIPEDRAALQPIYDWAAHFSWASPPLWFLQHALTAALDLQQENGVEEHLAKWAAEPGPYRHRAAEEPPPDVDRAGDPSPVLLALWSLAMPASYTSHPIPAPAPLPSWDPLSETEADYRSFLRSCGFDQGVEAATLEAYIRQVHHQMQVMVLPEEDFGQTRLNHLKVRQADVDARHGGYRSATWLALRVFDGLGYPSIVQRDFLERQGALSAPQSDGQEPRRVQRAPRADSIKKQVIRLAKETGIVLARGRPRGYRQSAHGRRTKG